MNVARTPEPSPLRIAFDRLAFALDRFNARLAGQSRAGFVVGSVLVALGVSLCCYAPRLQVLMHELPGTFEWARGLDFARQCEAPFNLAAHDPALRWRLLPAVVCHGIGLRGHAAFILPWVGLLLLLGQSVLLIENRTHDRALALIVTCLVATTSGIWTVTTWFGINDAWYLSALVAVAFARSPIAFALAAFAGPWIDERFLIGLPVALLLRFALGQEPGTRRGFALGVAGAALYLTVRAGVSLSAHDATAQSFVAGALRECWTWLPWAPLGWYCGFRAAWLVVLAGVVGLFLSTNRPIASAVAATAIASLLVLTVLAADLTRAPPLLLPLLFAGVLLLPTWTEIAAGRAALVLVLAANLLTPALHVTYTKVSLLSPLPIEIVRLLRKAAVAF